MSLNLTKKHKRIFFINRVNHFVLAKPKYGSAQVIQIMSLGQAEAMYIAQSEKKIEYSPLTNEELQKFSKKMQLEADIKKAILSNQPFCLKLNGRFI